MKYSVTKLIFIVLLFFFRQVMPLYAYTVAPTCPDFTNLNASCVEATTGHLNDPFETVGLVDGRHTLITTPSTDPRTGNLLQIIPSGETQVIKLGNQSVGAEAESLNYHFIVDNLNSILQFKYAVVFEDPGHPFVDQPRFIARVTDKDGNLFNGCSEYDVTCSANLEGFNTYQSGYSTVRWRDWTTMLLDLSEYVGEEVNVQFVSYDCGWTGHFGYAYFTANCIGNQFSLES